MGFFDFLFGRNREPERRQPQWDAPPPGRASRQRPYRGENAPQDENERALQRYHYLLRTAPPETIEQAHAEAFAQLTPEQRRMVLQHLAQAMPDYERQNPNNLRDDPHSLARLATRAEMRQPGTLERTFANVGGGAGIGLGGLMAGSFLSTIAGVVVGSAIANAFFDDTGYSDETGTGEAADAGADEAGAEDAGFETLGAEGDFGGDIGSDFGNDFGTDFGGDIGGDFGGGDIGGGDW